MIFPDLKTLKPFGLLFLFGTGAGATAADLQTLLTHSPFSPAPGSAAVKTEAAPETLEFRGLVVDERGTTYSLFDTTAQRSYWVREDGKGTIRFKAFDAEERVLEVEQDGRALTLPLKSAKIGTAAATPPAASPGRAEGRRPVRVVVRPAPVPAEVDRISKIAEQVRQRRAARQAAAGLPPTAAANPGF